MKIKIKSKYIWETIDVIPILPLIGVTHCLPILHMSKIMVYIYTTDEKINQFVIGYMINLSLHTNKVFREKVKKCLRATFNENKMENIIDVMKNKDTWVIALIMFYESTGKTQ